MRRGWPVALDSNIFVLAKLDARVPPTDIKVTTWSNVFGAGGSVSLDANMPDGKRVQLASISVDRDGPVKAERDHLRTLLGNWQSDDLAADWAALLKDAKAKVRDYYAEQVAEYGLAISEDVQP